MLDYCIYTQHVQLLARQVTTPVTRFSGNRGWFLEPKGYKYCFGKMWLGPLAEMKNPNTQA